MNMPAEYKKMIDTEEGKELQALTMGYVAQIEQELKIHLQEDEELESVRYDGHTTSPCFVNNKVTVHFTLNIRKKDVDAEAEVLNSKIKTDEKAI